MDLGGAASGPGEGAGVGHPMAGGALSWFLAASATTLVGRLTMREGGLAVGAANPGLTGWLAGPLPGSLRGIVADGNLGHVEDVARAVLADGQARVVRLTLVGAGRRGLYRGLLTRDRDDPRSLWLLAEPRRVDRVRRDAAGEAWALALTDPLTGLRNRRWSDRWLAARGGRPGLVWSCLLVDLDGFKSVNAAHGHDGGDRLLRAAARTLVEATRGGDRVARRGGDEFLVLLPATEAAGAAAVAERLRLRLAAPEVAAPASLGVAEHAPGEPPERTVARADAALRRAKAAGRDRVEVDPTPRADPPPGPPDCDA